LALLDDIGRIWLPGLRNMRPGSRFLIASIALPWYIEDALIEGACRRVATMDTTIRFVEEIFQGWRIDDRLPTDRGMRLEGARKGHDETAGERTFDSLQGLALREAKDTLLEL
jgi:hypothetical protein